jgi:methionyl aminopeptidase
MGRRSRPELKSAAEVALMREAGLIVADVLAACAAEAAPGVSTHDLDVLARDLIADAGALPSFLGLYGFPAHACISVDDQVLHGIPSADTVLREGSVLKVDVGAIVDGFHADAALTVPVGEAAVEAVALSKATEAALWAGLVVVRAGARLGEVGAAVQASIDGRYGLLREFCGHGIGRALHEAPDVWNTAGQSGGRLKLAVGHVLAIEPMATIGEPDVHELDDGWTVVTDSGAVGAHWEHTVAVTPTGPWVLTARDGGAEQLAAAGVAAGGPW